MSSGEYAGDVEAILAGRQHNGGDFWASADGRIGVGTPFSTFESPLILHELQVARSHEAIEGALQQILANWHALYASRIPIPSL